MTVTMQLIKSHFEKFSFKNIKKFVVFVSSVEVMSEQKINNPIARANTLEGYTLDELMIV